jgi:hypothetical protein
MHDLNSTLFQCFYVFSIWISELFPKLSDEESKHAMSSFDSRTNFKKYLVMYLESYKDDKLNEWINRIKCHNTKSAK